MEATIVLIVLIILFNLFSTLLRAARGRKNVSPRQPVSGGRRIDRPKFTVPPEAAEGYSPVMREDDLREEADTSSFYGKWVSDQETDEPAEEDYSEKPEEELFPAETEKFPEDEMHRGKPPYTEVQQSSPLAAGLRRVLADKDSLVAAFVFHELIGPPVSRRKKR